MSLARKPISYPNASFTAMSTLSSNAPNHGGTANKDIECYILSSDDELPLPKVRNSSKPINKATTAPSPKSIPGRSNASKLPLSKKSIGDSGVYFHSDDFDTTVDLSTNEPPPTAAGLLGLNRKQMEEERLLRAEQRRLAEDSRLHSERNSSPVVATVTKPPYIIFPKTSFTSAVFSGLKPTSRSPGAADEFDVLSHKSGNTIDLDDDPFDSPPTKKRRVSLSPNRSTSRAIPPKAAYQRSKSNIESLLTPGAAKTKSSTLQKASIMNKPLELDPITFTSSPDYPAVAKRRKEQKKKHVPGSDEDSVFGDIMPKKTNYSFDSDDDSIFGDIIQKKKKTLIRESGGSSSDDSLPDIRSLPTKVMNRVSSTGSQNTLGKYEAEKAAERKRNEKEQEKSAKQKARQLAKEGKDAEKEQKRIEKEEKAREKQKALELAQVNTLKTDKKISALEMIVHLPDSLDPKLKSQVVSFLGSHTVKHQEYECSQPIIKWQRKVVTEYKEDLGYWDKVRPYIRDEEHVMYVMTAKEFVNLAAGDEGDTLDLHVAQLNSQFKPCKLMYMIEGFEPWKRKNKTTKERQFKNAVRSHAGFEDSSTTQRQKKKKDAEYVDEDIVEDALCRLQLLGAKVHHTETMVVTAEWIVAFTLHISTIPYKYGFTLSVPLREITANLTAERSYSLTILPSVWTPAKSRLVMVHLTHLSKCSRKFSELRPQLRLV